MSKLSIPQMQEKKLKKEQITMLTAYDYILAKILEESGIDAIIVGDSVANVVLGYESTVSVTMEEMIHHAKAARKGAKNTFLVADMPFLSYQISNMDAIMNAGRFIKEALADAVKIEGGEEMLDRIKAVLNAGIPVLGHLGLTPQSATMLGGLKVQGKSIESAKKIYNDSILLQKAGCFAIILECVPQQLAKIIAEKLKIPVIGIGAGIFCDGQVLVTHDILGLADGPKHKFTKEYLDLKKQISESVVEFKTDVQKKLFPSNDNSFNINDELINRLKKEIAEK